MNYPLTGYSSVLLLPIKTQACKCILAINQLDHISASCGRAWRKLFKYYINNKYAKEIVNSNKRNCQKKFACPNLLK